MSERRRARRDPRRGAVSNAAEESLLPDAGLVRIAVLFVVGFAVLQALSWVIGFSGHLDPLLRGTARLTGALAAVFGIPATVSGTEISLATRVLRIDPACTAIPLMLVHAALVLAYPAQLGSKALGLLAGVASLAVANLVRLIVIAGLLAPLPDRTFFFVHDYLLELLMAAALLAVWWLYLSRMEARSATQG